jgi:hypothetical protein
VELDQAARSLSLIGRGDDDQRAVQGGHQGIEGVFCHQGLVSGSQRATAGLPAVNSN